MSANREGGQGTQKGQKPMDENEQNIRQPGQQQGQSGQGQGRQQQENQDRPTGGKENR